MVSALRRNHFLLEIETLKKEIEKSVEMYEDVLTTDQGKEALGKFKSRFSENKKQ